RLRREAQAELEGPLARESTESTGVHSGVDRLDADGTRVYGQESTNPATPGPLKKHLHRTAPLRWRSENHEHHESGAVAEEDHARDTASPRAEHLLRAMAGGKGRCFAPPIAGHCP